MASPPLSIIDGEGKYIAQELRMNQCITQSSFLSVSCKMVWISAQCHPHFQTDKAPYVRGYTWCVEMLRTSRDSVVKNLGAINGTSRSTLMAILLFPGCKEMGDHSVTQVFYPVISYRGHCSLLDQGGDHSPLEL